MEIHILYKQGLGIRAISRKLGYSRNTVRRYLRGDIKSPEKSRRSRGPGKLSSYKEYITSRLDSAYPDRIPATVIYSEICDMGYSGKISLLRAYISKYLSSKQPVKEIVRYETPAGSQMQVDWAEFRRGKDKLYGFIATLGYSRMSYVKFTQDMKIETLLSCIEESFEYFGGVCSRVLFDNMKTVVIERDAYGEGIHRFNKQLWDFAKHHGFIPKLCAPYRPQTKGKVERFIGYLKRSFYIPLKSKLKTSGLSLDVVTANIKVKQWLNDTANSRIHATTKELPFTMWEEDKKHMIEYEAYPYIKDKTKIPKPINKMTGHPETPIQHDLSVYQQLLTNQENNHYEHTTRTYS